MVDQNYRIIADSFHLTEGRYHVAPEVVRGFRGENGTSYNADKYYMIQTTPIYDNLDAKADDRQVEGVLLFISSTEPQRSELQSAKETLRIFMVVVAVLLALLSVLLTSMIMRPFAELRTALRKVSAGDLNQTVEQHSYLVTSQISEDVNTTLRKLRTLNESREEFVSNVSHELKTPITSMRVLADSLIGMGDAPLELYKEFMSDISKEIDREAKIIDDRSQSGPYGSRRDGPEPERDQYARDARADFEAPPPARQGESDRAHPAHGAGSLGGCG